jgi:CBS domain-containing protein
MSLDQTVLEAKRYGVYHCDRCQTLGDAALRMSEEDVSALVISDKEGYLAGVISRTDLLRALLEHENWQDQSIQEYMNADVITVSPQITLQEVARLLLDRHIHRVVVVQDEAGKKRPISVVSAADIVYHMAKSA